MLASLASVSISVTNVLAVETSERMVHRALIAQKPQALAATHPYATRTVAVFLLHKVMSARKAGRVLPEPVWKSNVGPNSGEELQNARAILGARQSGREVIIT